MLMTVHFPKFSAFGWVPTLEKRILGLGPEKSETSERLRKSSDIFEYGRVFLDKNLTPVFRKNFIYFICFFIYYNCG